MIVDKYADFANYACDDGRVLNNFGEDHHPLAVLGSHDLWYKGGRS